jgi:hypothetical protein
MGCHLSMWSTWEHWERKRGLLLKTCARGPEGSNHGSLLPPLGSRKRASDDFKGEREAQKKFKVRSGLEGVELELTQSLKAGLSDQPG